MVDLVNVSLLCVMSVYSVMLIDARVGYVLESVRFCRLENDTQNGAALWTITQWK